jgi:hypothetical protein
MGRPGKWFEDRFKTARFLPSYFETLARQWMNILFGETILGVVFLIWWALGTPPLTLIFVLAMLVAGYYAWYPYYSRSVPAIGIEGFNILETPTNHANISRVYVQVTPKCLSDSPLTECRGHLLRVWSRPVSTAEWKLTSLDEPLELLWSVSDKPSVTLQRGIDQRLNILWIENMQERLTPQVTELPLRAYSILSANEYFKFDIRITAKECAPADVSLVIRKGERWDRPSVEIV